MLQTCNVCFSRFHVATSRSIDRSSAFRGKGNLYPSSVQPPYGYPILQIHPSLHRNYKKVFQAFARRCTLVTNLNSKYQSQSTMRKTEISFKRQNRVDVSCVISNRFLKKKKPKMDRFKFVGTFVNGNGNNAIASSPRNSNIIVSRR